MKRLVLMAVIAIIAVALVTTPVLTVVAPFVSVWDLNDNKIVHIAGADSIVIDTTMVFNSHRLKNVSLLTLDSLSFILDGLIKLAAGRELYIDGGAGDTNWTFFVKSITGGANSVLNLDTLGVATLAGIVAKSSLYLKVIDADSLVMSKKYIDDQASSGTADSMSVDTDGDGTIDAYLYSTVAGAFNLKKGSNITLTVLEDTVTIASTGGGGASFWDSNLVKVDSIVYQLVNDAAQAGINDTLLEIMIDTSTGDVFVQRSLGGNLFFHGEADDVDTTGTKITAMVDNRIDDSLANYLDLAGTQTMNGNLDMGGFAIVDITEIDGNTGLNLIIAAGNSGTDGIIIEVPLNTTRWTFHGVNTNRLIGAANAAIVLDTIVGIGGTITTPSRIFINANTNQHQFIIQANATQDSNLFIIEASDGTDLIVVDDDGELEVIHVASHLGSRALKVEMDAAGIGGSAGIDLDLITDTIAAAEDVQGLLINIDQNASTGGDIIAMSVLSTSTGSATVIALEVGVEIEPIFQESGTFGNLTFAEWRGSGAYVDWVTNANTTVTDEDLWIADNDTVFIGFATTFEELEWIWETVATKDMFFEFFYSVSGPSWTAFSPIDGTDGATGNGVMAWNTGDLASWASVSVDGDAAFWIAIVRTRTTATGPTEDLVQIAAPINYEWNKDGNIMVNAIIIDSMASFSGSKILATDYIFYGDSTVAGSTSVTQGFVQREIEDSLNEYSLTTAIVLVDGSNALTADWAAGAFDITGLKVIEADTIRSDGANTPIVLGLGDTLRSNANATMVLGSDALAFKLIFVDDWRWTSGTGDIAYDATDTYSAGDVLKVTAGVATWEADNSGGASDSALTLVDVSGGFDVIRWNSDTVFFYEGASAAAGDTLLKLYLSPTNDTAFWSAEATVGFFNFLPAVSFEGNVIMEADFTVHNTIRLEGATVDAFQHIIQTVDVTGSDKIFNMPNDQIAAGDVLVGSGAQNLTYLGLATTEIVVGDGSGAPSAVSLSADVLMSNTGVVTIQDDAVQESDLEITNAGSAGNVLSKGAGDDFTWIAAGGGASFWDSNLVKVDSVVYYLINDAAQGGINDTVIEFIIDTGSGSVYMQRSLGGGLVIRADTVGTSGGTTIIANELDLGDNDIIDVESIDVDTVKSGAAGTPIIIGVADTLRPDVTNEITLGHANFIFKTIHVDSLAALKITDNIIDSADIVANALSFPSDIAAFTEAELEARLSDVTAVFTNNVTGDVTVSGGTSTIGTATIDSLMFNQVEIGKWLEDTLTIANHTWTGVLDFGGATTLEIPNAASPTTSAEGDMAWDSGDDELEIHDGSAGVIIAQRTWTAQVSIDDPDNLVYDTVSILYVNADKYPGGITITGWGFSRVSTTSSTMDIYEATDLNSGLVAIEQIATCTTEECEDDGSIANASIASGSYVLLDYNDVDESGFMVWITFTVNPN